MIDILCCPFDGTMIEQGLADELNCRTCGRTYPVIDGIPRFLVDDKTDVGQSQVADAFSFKWTRDEWGFRPEVANVMKAFFFERFGFQDDNDLESFFSGKTILHAGVGSGQCEQVYLKYASRVCGVDISNSVEAARKNWLKYFPSYATKLHLVQADLMHLPLRDGAFDIVLSDGVLHHTPNTFDALAAITKKVKPGGVVMFYVYKKKSPIREFVDDYIRNEVGRLSATEAWTALEPLTALAKMLHSQQIDIEVPDDINLLELHKGRYDLQRWLYWNFMKFYWNDAMTFDENNHINFDWYYPRYAWRHTQDEVQSWLARLGLKYRHFNVSDSGISVIAEK